MSHRGDPYEFAYTSNNCRTATIERIHCFLSEFTTKRATKQHRHPRFHLHQKYKTGSAITSPCLVLLQVGLGALARLRACQSAQQPLTAAYSLWLCYSVPAPRPEFLLTLQSSSICSWVGLANSSVHVCLGCQAAPSYGGVCTHWQHGYRAAWPWGSTC